MTSKPYTTDEKFEVFEEQIDGTKSQSNNQQALQDAQTAAEHEREDTFLKSLRKYQSAVGWSV